MGKIEREYYRLMNSKDPIYSDQEACKLSGMHVGRISNDGRLSTFIVKCIKTDKTFTYMSETSTHNQSDLDISDISLETWNRDFGFVDPEEVGDDDITVHQDGICEIYNLRED